MDFQMSSREAMHKITDRRDQGEDQGVGMQKSMDTMTTNDTNNSGLMASGGAP
jgi:hypothetical protein